MSEYDIALGGAPGGDALVGGGELIGAPDANGLIVHPRDADVLCGRGGAALRHPGNQTYRRLVNLNKGLYITCLKTEKLKISRSIVAAIREQNGRFLEKSADQNAWYDIGDKKAVEKTSQALREGQPKLRQKIIEMGVAANPNDSPGGVDGTDKVDIVVGGAYGEAPYGGGGSMKQNMLQQQLMQQSNHSMMQQQSNTDLSQQQMMQPHQMAPISMSSSSVNNTQDLHAELLRRLSLHDLQQNISTTSFQQQQQSMSTNSMQPQQQAPNNFPPTSVEQQLLQQQQLLFNQQQQQQQNRSTTPQQQRPPMNARASFARELGISESQLSIMSDFSGYGGGSMSGLSGFGSGPLNASGHSVLGSTTTSMSDMQALMNIDSSFRNALMGMPLGSMHTATGGDPSLMDNAMNTNSNLGTNQAQMFINNQMQQQFQQQQQPQQFYQQQQQLPQQNAFAPMAQQVTGAMMSQQPTQQSMPQSVPTGTANQAMSGGSGTAMPNSNFDRRRVFAKMKYTRPPSVQSVSGGTGVSQVNLPSNGEVVNGGPQRQPIQQQQSGRTVQTMHTTATTEDMNNFHLVDSNGMESSMSLFSTMSNTPSQVTSINNASAAAQGGLPPNNVTTGNVGNTAGYDQTFVQKQQQQPHQPYSNNASNFPTMNQPSNFTTHDTGFSKVVVETAKVVDHSSGGRMNNSSMFNDAMSIGSRNSLMSGLSRISDTSYDNSIFSDLSKKIGNVSTRSMAMSEMSALEIQELNEDDDNNDVDGEGGDLDDDSAPGDIDNYVGEASTNV